MSNKIFMILLEKGKMLTKLFWGFFFKKTDVIEEIEIKILLLINYNIYT